MQLAAGGACGLAAAGLEAATAEPTGVRPAWQRLCPVPAALIRAMRILAPLVKA